MTPADLELLEEATTAGRDVTAMYEAEEQIRLAIERLEVGCTHKHKAADARQKCWERLTGGPDKARASAQRRWSGICDESKKERKAARDAMQAWAKGNPARLRLVAVVHCGINRRLAWHPAGGTKRIHWESMMLRRWVRILGLTSQYERKMKRKVDDEPDTAEPDGVAA